MITIPTVEGKLYAVSATTTCTITSESGTVIGTAEPGTQFFFQAQKGITTTLSDDAAEYSAATFNRAPYQKLTLLGVVGGNDNGGLPAGYFPCDFLESTGSQYINTGYLASGDTDFFAIKFSETRLDNAWVPVFGSSIADDDDGFFLQLAWYLNTNVGAFKYGDQLKGLTWSALGVNVLETNTFTFQNNALSINGESVLTVNSNDFSLPNPVVLFGMWNKTKPWGFGYFRIHSFEIGQNGTKAVNYIPCLDNTGTPCMFDTVTRQPFYNQGSGAFIAGLTAAQARSLGNLPEGGGTLTISLPSDVVDENGVLQDMAIFTALSAAAAKGWSFILQTHDGTAVETAVPAGYMECEFLESTGSQYIDTGLTLSNESEVSCEFMTVELTGVVQRLYGCFTAPRFACYSAYPEYMTVTCYIPDDSKGAGTNAVQLGKKITLCHNIEKYIMEGVEYRFNTTPSAFETPLSCQIFTTDSETKNIAHARIYSFFILRNGVSQLNYTPAINAQGVPCMYDSVTAQPFTNDGSGKFVVGMTAAQAVQLANLPSIGGELTVSLPQSILNDDGEITDAAVRAALNKAADNGWTITLQYYTES